MKVRAAAFLVLAVLALGVAGGVVRSSGHDVVPGEVPVLETAALSMTITGADGFRLANKLSGKVYDVSAAPFEIVIGPRAARTSHDGAISRGPRWRDPRPT